MKKTILIIFLLPFVFCAYAQKYNLKGIKYAQEMFRKDALSGDKELTSFYNYISKNSKFIDAEVLEVIHDNDTVNCCLVKVYKNNSSKYSLAILETKNEVMFEGREFEREVCFLAGTYTYESKGKEKKTIPVYYSLDRLNYSIQYKK